MTQFMAYMA